MRPSAFPHPRSTALLTGVLSILGAAASAQPALEARVRALEARMATVEARVGVAAAAAAPSAADCEALHFGFNSPARLTVTANGRTIGSYDRSASEIITDRLRPGANSLVFTFSGPGGQMQLNCTPPGGQETTILRFSPTPGRLEERITLTLPARR
jgi:hypothetical protein